MILPATLIVILTSAFWKILIELLPKVPGARLLDLVHISTVGVAGWFAPSGIAALRNSLKTDPQNAPTIRQAIDTLINMQGNDLIVFCLVLVFVGVLAVWALLLPVIMADVDPPNGDPEEANLLAWLKLGRRIQDVEVCGQNPPLDLLGMRGLRVCPPFQL